MPAYPPPEQLTAHQPPALLVERVVDADAGLVRLRPDGFDALTLVEGCAQALAVLMGCRLRRSGRGEPASGMLVGAKGLTVARAPRRGEAVEVQARCLHELGALQLYEVVARVGAEELARGELKVATTQPMPGSPA